jgi:5-(carboxyamino)imidazole ribonucleotide synthase
MSAEPMPRASEPRAEVPPPRVGIVGAGQLARMTHRAAIDLGIEVTVLATAPEDPAVTAGADHLLGAPDSLDDLLALAEISDVVTLDHERVPTEHLVALAAAGHPVRPSPEASLAAQDKLHARRLLGDRLGLPVPDFAPVAGAADVARFGLRHGWPVVLKARRGGYDGRGVRIAHSLEEAAATLVEGGEWVAERHLDLERELAVLVARRPSGEAVAYPVAETVQEDGMCREMLVPAPVGEAQAQEARDLALRIAEEIGATGILAVELFVSGGRLLVNELALRPHNSGHWTIEGAETSQFENHLRAVLDWPLGATGLTAPGIATVNIVGAASGEDPRRHLPEALAVAGAHVHLYGKGARPGRKLGHVTARGEDADAALGVAASAAGELMRP